MFAVAVRLGAAPGRREAPGECAGVVNFALEDERELARRGTGRSGRDVGDTRAGVVTVSPCSPHMVAVHVSGGGAPRLLEPPGGGAGVEGLAHELEWEDTGGSSHCPAHSPAAARGCC